MHTYIVFYYIIHGTSKTEVFLLPGSPLGLFISKYVCFLRFFIQLFQKYEFFREVPVLVSFAMLHGQSE